MARQTVNIGTIANDGTGDTLRNAGRKINENFAEIYGLLGGDSSSLGAQTQLTDSGIDFYGVTNITKLGFAEGTSTVNINLPDSDGTLITDQATQIIINKTISADTNTLSGLAASSFVLSDASGNIDGSASQKAIPTGVVVGTTDLQTLTNKTLDSATINNPIIDGVVRDPNGAEIFHIGSVTNAVNHLDFQNAITGAKPILAAHSDVDSDVSLDLRGQNRGAVVIEKIAYGATIVSADGVVSRTSSHIICDKSSTLTLSMADGSQAGEIKIITNKGTGAAVVTPQSFLQGSTVTVSQYGACSFIWDGISWYVTGYNRDSDVSIS